MNPRLLEQAAKLAQGPDPSLARPLIEGALAVDAADPDALSLLGLLAQRNGDLRGAIDAFSRACEADPANPAFLANLGVALKQVDRFDEAIAVFDRSLAIRPVAPGTLANLGSCFIAAGRHGEALAPLRKGVEIKPDHVEGWNNLGVALARSGARKEAIDAYRRALQLKPDYAEAALNLADVIDDPKDAETIAARVLRDRPGHPRAANIVATLRDRAGDLDGAIAAYRSALDSASSAAIGINLTMALLRSNRADEALAQADRMVDEAPRITTPLALKCVALERLGRSDELSQFMALDRFVSIIDLTVDEPFHAELEEDLREHSSLTYEPEGLVTRAGRQSDDLADAMSPALQRLATLAGEQLGQHRAVLAGNDHPWLRARPSDWSLTMWGTILQPGGAVEPHIHAPNWLSGVYYPALPDAVGRTDEGGLAIGIFPAALGGGGDHHVYAARPGRMILFPSWMWHATLPFGGTRERISFAFDMVPEGIGQKHHLKK